MCKPGIGAAPSTGLMVKRTAMAIVSPTLMYGSGTSRFATPSSARTATSTIVACLNAAAFEEEESAGPRASVGKRTSAPRLSTSSARSATCSSSASDEASASS
eukprot:scaffold72490_cov26-Tisochrysis_lutea.AAC.1